MTITEDKKNSYLRANIPIKFWGAEIDKVAEGGVVPYRPIIEGYIGSILEMISNGWGLMLYGPAKHGRTYLGCLILKEAIDKGKTAYSISLRDLTENQKKPFNDAYTVHERSRQVDILLLDDVIIDEKELPGPQLDILRDILRYRDAWKKSTILIIQGTPNKISDTDRKIIEEKMKMVEVNAVDYGKIAGEEREKKMDALIEEGVKTVETANGTEPIPAS
jgi:hypothetical protein